MSTGDFVTAGKITTAYNTTDLVAETEWSNCTPTEYFGQVIFRVVLRTISPTTACPMGPWTASRDWATWAGQALSVLAADS